MKYQELRKYVYEANMLLPKYNLVTFTWGNVSQIDRKAGVFGIKPSGVEYDELKPENIVILDLEGNVLDGDMNPSSDVATHLELYRNFSDISGVVHTHSRWATCFSQAGRSITPFGTTGADYFYGAIPCTRDMTQEEINGHYEQNTGKVIVETFKEINPIHTPAVLVKNHGPFTFGKDAYEAVYHAVVLEEIAMMALHTMVLSPNCPPINKTLMDKHFLRKHGENAYYGQQKKVEK